MNSVWREGGRLNDAIRLGAVTLVVGAPGCGKTTATSVLSGMAKTEGRKTHLVDRDVQYGDMGNRLLQNIQEAADGDLVIARDVFETDGVSFTGIATDARKRNLSVAIEMQTVDLNAALNDGFDVLAMRLSPGLLEYNSSAAAHLDCFKPDRASLLCVRTGEGFMLSQGHKPKRIRVEISRPAVAD